MQSLPVFLEVTFKVILMMNCRTSNDFVFVTIITFYQPIIFACAFVKQYMH